MNSLPNYILLFVLAINTRDAAKLKHCLSISPGGQEGPIRAKYPEPNDFDLYQAPEKFRGVIRAHLRLMRAVYVEKSIDQSFVELDDLVNHLIRAGETQTNWINVPLMNAMFELMAVYKVRELRHPEEIASLEFQDVEGSDAKVSALEQLANTANKAFKLLLNDKNLELQHSKRMDIYFFLAVLIKIYFKMNKLELAKSIEKALKGTRFQLPDMKSSVSNKKAAVTYLYYSSLLSLDESDFEASENKLEEALDILTGYPPKNKQVEQILLVLLPLKLYNKRASLKPSLWAQYPQLKTLYHDNLFRAISTGNIALFDAKLEQYQTVFLKNHLYLLIELLRLQCHLNLIRRTTSVVRTLNPTPQNHIVPFSAYQKAFEVASSGPMPAPDEVECILATMVATGRIKGYLSHGNRCIVLSKAVPFPA
ncbi:protein CSN12 [Suhomyces tanzawaensis NRRL Y-17324]|uniref:Protein CSN12 n=1 Tax=Suhomyces tanzawaensis NRRL Y-17324 TaxID=984487 RepID=A0A1E4SGN4_9ASCO|nr:protein CSN12 [Suhomyces tanzawaensis NRRL Y-17324]ODV78677.1 protein CSN12 [Suhomyces tanzawaensis NRRL Y-17324]